MLGSLYGLKFSVSFMLLRRLMELRNFEAIIRSVAD